MDAYDTGKGLPEQIDREGNTGFMQEIALTLPLQAFDLLQCADMEVPRNASLTGVNCGY
jgi:hypothetical protein